MRLWKRLWGRTLIVVDDVAQMVATAVVGFAHTHRIVRKIDIAIIAWRLSVRALGGRWKALGCLCRWLS
jgi:hypothetical protein